MASGLFFDADGNDETMEILSKVVDTPEDRLFYFPNPGRVDVNGVTWWLTDPGVWYRTENRQIITGNPVWPEGDVMYHCPFCHNPVMRDDEKTWKQVSGWVGGRRKDSMRLREDTGLYAHEWCVRNLTEGIPPGQPDLFEEAGS